MFFSWKNPLKRRISAQDIFKAQEGGHDHEAFLGASLLDKKGVFLALELPVIYRVSGASDTYGPDVAVKLMRAAVEKRLSILAVDFTGGEIWHRFWAMAFYLDRAKDFRVLNLHDAEHSDALGAFLPAGLSEIPAHLTTTAQAFDAADHLKNHQGLVALCAPEHAESFKTPMWELTQTLMSAPDLLVICGWDELSGKQQQAVLQERIRRNPKQPGLVLTQKTCSEIRFVSESEPVAHHEMLFRQAAAMPDLLFQRMKSLAEASAAGKILEQMSAALDGFEENQCLLLRGEKVDLVQTPSGEGLPWPPDYKPLRSRFPGN